MTEQILIISFFFVIEHNTILILENRIFNKQ